MNREPWLRCGRWDSVFCWALPFWLLTFDFFWFLICIRCPQLLCTTFPPILSSVLCLPPFPSCFFFPLLLLVYLSVYFLPFLYTSPFFFSLNQDTFCSFACLSPKTTLLLTYKRIYLLSFSPSNLVTFYSSQIKNNKLPRNQIYLFASFWFTNISFQYSFLYFKRIIIQLDYILRYY